MHVLFIVSWYKTPSRPLAGTFFEEQARAFMKRGYRIGVLYPDLNMQFSSRFKKRTSDPPKDFVDNGLPTMYHFLQSIVPRNRALNYRYLGFSILRKFAEYVKRYGKPDLIHAHCVFNAGIAARYISRRHKIPYIVTEHYSGIVSDVHKIEVNRKIARAVYNASSKNIAVSSNFANEISKKYGVEKNKFVVIPNIVNSLFFDDEIRSNLGGHKIFTNSFLTQIKNHKLLFEAFKCVHEKMPDAELVVGGDGTLRSELEAYAKTLKLDKAIKFLGALSRAEVKQQLCRCDLFVSSSRYETFGVAIIEALACGKPVVATNSGGPKDIINSDNGILVNQHTPEALSEAIFKMFSDYQRFDPKKIQANCKERFGEDVVLSELVEVYKDASLPV